MAVCFLLIYLWTKLHFSEHMEFKNIFEHISFGFSFPTERKLVCNLYYHFGGQLIHTEAQSHPILENLNISGHWRVPQP